MTSHNQYHINRLEKEIANLDAEMASLSKRRSDLLRKINRLHDDLSRTKSIQTVNSKLREIERHNKSLADIESKQAINSKKKSEKSSRLREYYTRQNREEEKARKKARDEERKMMRERELYERRISSMTNVFHIPREPTLIEDGADQDFDFFICHSSEDKEELVRELAKSLESKGAKVWYDEFVLKIGDSLGKEINRGLARSRFGVVILSRNFFGKSWPEQELSALVTRENSGQIEQTRILPIWHNISRDQVAEYSPILADRIAIQTSSMTVDEIANDLMRRLENA